MIPQNPRKKRPVSTPGEAKKMQQIPPIHPSTDSPDPETDGGPVGEVPVDGICASALATPP
jgi:hypothetical protein